MEPDTKPSLYAGQPIAANLTIRTSFHWGGQNVSMRRCVLRFNVEEMVREWLISGPKRGDFLATVSHLPNVKKHSSESVFSFSFFQKINK